MQEHNIRILKAQAQRRDSAFGGDFFSKIIARNVRAFIDIKHLLPEGLGLGKLSEKHGTAKSTAVPRMLQGLHDRVRPHIFREGRSFGFTARDDFTEGYLKLGEGGKLKTFLDRTLVDPVAVQDGSVGESDLTDGEVADLPRQQVFAPVIAEGQLSVEEDGAYEEQDVAEASTLADSDSDSDLGGEDS